MTALVVAAIVVAALVLILVLLLLGRRRLLRRALPPLKGTLRLEGLQAPVEVLRDRYGIPHVLASSTRDAAFAMGVLHAHERLWQMEFTRRVAAGRVSEFAGREGLAVDRFMRRVGLARCADGEVAGHGGEVREGLEAYCDGVNSVINSRRPLPLEFRLLRYRPEPWRPEDTVLCAKLLALGLSLNWDVEIQRLRMVKALGPELTAKLDLAYPEDNPTIIRAAAAATEGAPRAPGLTDLLRDAAPFLPQVTGGSNSWVVAGVLTESGNPLLCNDPHLPPSIPSVWYVAHVRAGDDFESTGVTNPGIPFPIIGHNRRIAWGYTNSFVDAQDLVIEEFTDASAQEYRTERGAATSEIVREVIKVKGGSDEIEEVVITRHGPVVERMDNPDAGTFRGLALQWTGLVPGGDIAGAMMALQRAHDWESFRQAFAGFDAPSQNVVYADVDGHIGYFLCGRVPVRRRPPSGLPVPGWDGTALWERFLTVDEVPQLYDPPEQLIVTANNRITMPGAGPYIGNDYMNGYRAARLTQLLSRRGLTAADMQAVQMDTLSIPATQVADQLRALRCRDEKAEKLRQQLASFDGDLRADRREPLLYQLFLRRLHEEALRPLCGDAWELAAGYDLDHPVFGYPGNLVGRFTPKLLQMWRGNDVSLLGEGNLWADVAERALAAAAADAGRHRGRWGRIHRLPLEHLALGKVRFVRSLFNRRGIEVGGDTDTVLQSAYHPMHPYRTTIAAPSWRQVMDLGNWDASTGVHYPGQSGHPGSKHYADLVTRWRRNRPYPLTWSTEAVRRQARRRLVLEPATTSTAGGGR